MQLYEIPGNLEDYLKVHFDFIFVQQEKSGCHHEYCKFSNKVRFSNNRFKVIAGGVTKKLIYSNNSNNNYIPFYSFLCC